MGRREALAGRVIVARCKEGVWTTLITEQALRILEAVSRVWATLGRSEPPTVTSWMDGKHVAGSRHFDGLALDIRIWGLSAAERQKAVALLRDELGRAYDVVLEPTHIHIEYDPKPEREPHAI